MKKYFFYLSMALVAFVVASCGLKGNHTSSGRPYELLVVVDAGVWDRAAGRALHDVLDSDMPGLPQSEPSFQHPFRINYYRYLKKIKKNPLSFRDTLRALWDKYYFCFLIKWKIKGHKYYKLV